MTDTTQEAVEQLGTWIAHNASPTGIDLYNEAIEALLTRAEAAEAKLKVAEADSASLADEVVKLCDRIQTQTGQIKAAEANGEKWRSMWEKEQSHNEELRAERDALQAKLALAMEALRQIEDGYGANHMSNFARMVASGARAQLTADTIPDPRIEGWNAAIDAAAKVYGKPFHSGGVAKSMAHFVRVDDHRKYQEACAAYRDAIRAIQCPFTPKEGKDDE